MSETITLPEIIQALQAGSGKSAEEIAEFIHALTDTIAERLVADGRVTVDGIGEFRVVEVDDGQSVEFHACKALADEVNAPFALFDAVDLSAGVTEQMLEVEEMASDDNQTAPPQCDDVDDDETADTPEPAAPAQSAEETVMETPSIDAVSAQPSEQLPHGIPPVPVNTEKPVRTDDPAADAGIPVCEPEAPRTAEMDVYHGEDTCRPRQSSLPDGRPDVDFNEAPMQSRQPNRSRKEIVIFVLVGLLSLLAGLLVGHFGIPGLNINGVKSVKITAEEVTLLHGDDSNTPLHVDTVRTDPIAADSAATGDESQAAEDVSGIPSDAPAEEPAPVVPKVVTDTVGGRNYLSTIARKHYGKDIFWVYIYEENKDKISNPNNIQPGTVVVIPPADKYGIDPASKESVRAAERLSGQIIGDES